MHIRVGLPLASHPVVSLERAADCAELHIESAGLDPLSVEHALLASGAAVAIDRGQFLISVAWLEAQAGELAQSPSWANALRSLVASLQGSDPIHAAVGAVRVGMGRDAGRSPSSPSAAAGWVTGVGLTSFGRYPGVSALDWQARAAVAALADGGRAASDVDGLLVGYATTVSHLMPANLLAEYLGMQPSIALGVSVGGATGLAMLAQAVSLLAAGKARCVLVVGGEDRASGQSRDRSTEVLAQVGHRDYEVPIGANIPAYYALLASAYFHRYGSGPAELAPLAVQMRRHAESHPGAQFREPIDAATVLASRPVADPLRLLDCCPVSDGGAALLLESGATDERAVAVTGVGHANRHQHLSEADLDDLGARSSAESALSAASLRLADIDIAGIYDSFTITLALLLEEIGFAKPGTAGEMARQDAFDRHGRLPLNTHGGLLSYGHPGVAGGMAHVVEMVRQLRGEAGDRQIPGSPRRALLHADGGVLSAHVTAILDHTGREAA